MKVLYLIHTVEKPYLEYVPQFGHVRFCVCRASALMASSGDMEDDVAPPPPPFPGMLAFLQFFGLLFPLLAVKSKDSLDRQ